MRIARHQDISAEVQKNPPRDGRFEFQRLLEGKLGTPGNFLFRITRLGTDFYSPRHMHNFDQLRYFLEGETDFSRDGKLKKGMLGYFPEGTAYGPQTIEQGILVATLQFGGASGQGYMSADQVDDGVAELKKSGEVTKGVFTRTLPDGRKRSMDSYQAVWELVNGRKMMRPKPRYQKPIFMDPENCAWIASPDQPGVMLKHLGSFTECETRVGFCKVSAGSTLALVPHSIYLALSGSGHVGQTGWGSLSAIHLEAEDRATLSANEDAELFHIRLPAIASTALQPSEAARFALAG